jgi:hypothetical protein
VPTLGVLSVATSLILLILAFGVSWLFRAVRDHQMRNG